MNTTNLFVELLVIGILRLQGPDEVAAFRGLRRVPENDIGIVGRGGGKLYPADPEQSAKACLAQVDAANVRMRTSFEIRLMMPYSTLTRLFLTTYLRRSRSI